MSSGTQETLTFRINTVQSGMTAAALDKLTASLKALGAIKISNTGGLGPLLEQIGTGSKGASASIDQLTTKVKSMGSAFSAAASSMSPLSNAVKQVSTEMKTAEASMSSFVSKSSGIVSSLRTITSAFETASGVIGNFSAKAKTVADAFGFSSTAFNQLNTTIRGLQVSIERLIGIEEKLATSTNLSSAAMEKLRASMTGANAGVNTYVSANQKAVSSNQQLASSNEQVASSMNLSRGAMKAGAQEMTNYISRAAGMFISVVGLSQAVQESVGMQETLKDAHEQVAESQARVNALQEAGMEGTKEYNQALKELNKDKRAETIFTRNASYAYSDQLYFVSLLGVELVGVLIPALKKVKEMQAAAAVSGLSFVDVFTNKFKGLSTAFKAGFGGKELVRDIDDIGGAFARSASPTEKFVRSVKGIGSEIPVVATSTTRLGTALGVVSRALAIASPAIAAVVGGIAIYATNMGGARDSANAFGAAVGNQLPILKPFGELLVGIAGKLGLTGESADEVAIHFERAGQQFANMGSLWNTTIQGLINSSDEFSQNVGQNLLKASDAVVQMSSDFVKQLGMTANAWSTFMDQLNRKDYKAAVDSIGMALAALPGIFETAISEFGDVMDGLWGAIQPSLAALGERMYGIFVESMHRVDEAIYGGFVEAFKRLEGVVGFLGEIGKRIYDGIIGGLSTLGADILKILDPSTWIQQAFADDGNSKSTVDSWIKTNITDPINGFLTYITVTATDIWGQIESGAQGIVGQVNTWINTNIVDPINQFVQNISVSAKQIWTQIISGAGSIAGEVMTWINGNIVDPINKFVQNISVNAQQIWTQIVSGAGSIVGTVNTWINGNIVEPINNLYQRLTDQARSIVDKLLNGDYISAIVSWAKSVAADIADQVLAQVRANPIGSMLLDALGIKGGTGGGTGTSAAGSTGGMSKEQIAKMNAEKQAKTTKDLGLPSNTNLDQSIGQYGFNQLFGGGQTIPSAYGAEQDARVYKAGGQGNTFGFTGTGFTVAPSARQKIATAGTAGAGVGPGIGFTIDSNDPLRLTPGEIAKKQQRLDRQKAMQDASKPEPQLTNKLLPVFQGMDKKKLDEMGFPELNGEDKKAQTDFISDMIFDTERLIKVQDMQKMSTADLADRLIAIKGIYGEQSKSIKDNSIAYDALNTALGDSVYQQGLVTLGAQDQAGKYQNLQAEIFKNTGVLQEYNKQLGSQQFINDNVTAGMQAQQIAFNDQTVAIAQNEGALKACLLYTSDAADD